jgi:hypothetical protein
VARPKDEERDAPTGLEHVDISDLLSNGFRAAVYKALPLADPRRRVDAFDEVVLRVRCYRGFRDNKRFNLSSREVREYLQRGLDLARDLEIWLTDIPSIARDYVLSAVGREANKHGREVSPQNWSDLGKRFRALRLIIDQALRLVHSDRGRPENAELNDLVLSLAQVWDEYANSPFGLTKQGVHTPYKFVRMVSQAADPGITQADFDRQLGTALRLATRRLRRRRAERGKK